MSDHAHEDVSVVPAAPERAPGTAVVGHRARTSVADTLLELQAKAGNRSVISLIQRFPDPAPPPQLNKAKAETGARSRVEDFVSYARTQGVPREVAVELFDIAGGGKVDPLTGYGSGADRNATALMAAAHGEKSKAPTFQVDADLQNLGGLNAAEGHSGSDRVYSQIAAIVTRWLNTTGYQVEPFRSGGELSYIVIARGETEEKSARDRINTAMSEAEKQVKGFIANMGLTNIANPRGGVGGLAVQIDVVTTATANARKQQAATNVAPLAPETNDPKTSFVSAPARRRERFMDLVGSQGLEGGVADALWQAAGSGNPDALTGFAGPGDRTPTVEGAIKHVSGGGAACYVEIDIGNVGGMNRVSKELGDEIVRDLAAAARAAVAGVGGDVTAIRHGGDEVSFVVVSDGDSASLKERLVAALSSARTSASSELAHLDWVPNPKRLGQRGTGIYFGVAAISASSDPEAVFHEADTAVEAMKVG